jgi:hypothetical protein
MGFTSIREKKRIMIVPARTRTNQRHRSGNCCVGARNL